MRASILFVFSICLALPNSQLKAQSTAADGNVRTNIQGIDIPAVANAPFTAKIVVTWDQPLVGGGTISRSYYTLVARDSQGRVHRETRDFVPANSGAEPRLRSFAITDPVAGTRTVCTTTGMTCATAQYQPRVALRVALTDQADGAFGSGSGNLKSETLGEQLIDSMRVVGTRETATTSAGDRGNSRLVVSNRETWYSPDLKMDLSVSRNNPQLGQVTLSVTNLVRGEPDASWFAIPQGYAVKNASLQ
jgi:hypothetical protein